MQLFARGQLKMFTLPEDKKNTYKNFPLQEKKSSGNDDKKFITKNIEGLNTFHMSEKASRRTENLMEKLKVF